MTCKHEHLRCTNNVFTCIDCGAIVPDPAVKQEEPKPKKTKKKETEK